jgi:hypothetical protein
MTGRRPSANARDAALWGLPTAAGTFACARQIQRVVADVAKHADDLGAHWLPCSDNCSQRARVSAVERPTVPHRGPRLARRLRPAARCRRGTPSGETTEGTRPCAPHVEDSQGRTPAGGGMSFSRLAESRDKTASLAQDLSFAREEDVVAGGRKVHDPCVGHMAFELLGPAAEHDPLLAMNRSIA